MDRKLTLDGYPVGRRLNTGSLSNKTQSSDTVTRLCLRIKEHQAAVQQTVRDGRFFDTVGWHPPFPPVQHGRGLFKDEYHEQSN